MVTNEEMISGLPEDAIRAIESSSCVETFEGNIDSQNRWLLRTPFDAAASGIVPGMIARIARSGFSQTQTQTYVIDAATTSGFILRIPGYPAQIGQGPGAIFGIETVKARILDMKSALNQAQITVDSRFGSVLSEDAGALAMKSAAVKLLALIRMANDNEFLRTFTGSIEFSPFEFECRILDRLGSDLLMRMSKVSFGAMSWPRVRR